MNKNRSVNFAQRLQDFIRFMARQLGISLLLEMFNLNRWINGSWDEPCEKAQPWPSYQLCHRFLAETSDILWSSDQIWDRIPSPRFKSMLFGVTSIDLLLILYGGPNFVPNITVGKIQNHVFCKCRSMPWSSRTSQCLGAAAPSGPSNFGVVTIFPWKSLVYC